MEEGKAATSRKRCWERSGDLKGAQDWGLCLASDARGSYAVAGCRGGDLKLWLCATKLPRPPSKWHQPVGRGRRRRKVPRFLEDASDVRTVAVDDNERTRWVGWYGLVRSSLWDARTSAPSTILHDTLVGKGRTGRH